MNDLLTSPPFGQADLTNCERELIHLAGSIQPHGVLLVLREADLAVLQASANAEAMLGVRVESLLGMTVGALGGDLEAVLRRLLATADLTHPEPLRGVSRNGAVAQEFEGVAHRSPGAGLIVELEPVASGFGAPDAVDADDRRLQQALAAAVQRFSETSTVAALADAVVQSVRDLVGYDRVMVYRFDPDGHGEVIAEARDERLEAFLGRHYPASDIPQRARELYVRNRVRVLVDVNYVPVPIEPRHSPLSGEELDMSLCALRSMSPLHTQYLKNMGVTATLVVSIVRDGSLWGLIACHHYSPRRVRYAVRAAADVLAEVIATRLAAIENYVQVQAEALVRRLEQRLIEATSVEGDWRHALVGNPRFVLQPLDATGAALFYDGEVLTVGEVPSTPELRALAEWVGGRTVDSLFECASVARANPALRALTPTASGVLAVELSRSRPDYLMWFRKEQLLTVDWAGDPAKPVIGNDPLELSPRRSFAVWSEIVRETAAPWTHAELALAAAMGASLRDILVQIHAVRLLIAQHQLMQVRVTVDGSKSPVVIADAGGRILLANEAFSRLLRRPHGHLEHLDDIAALCSEPQMVRRMLGVLRSERRPWRGELSLAKGGPERVPLGVRADVVPGPDGAVLGFILILSDLTESKRAEAARRHLEDSLSRAGREGAAARSAPEPDEVIGAILANASVAGMEIADAGGHPAVAQVLEELEASAKRAAALYRQLRAYTRDR
jgi:light-regulated signal transduction histidine kinase (bacteriophytochrome)